MSDFQPISPISLIREAIVAVPAVKWALGVGGIIAVIALIGALKVDYIAAIVGFVIIICAMMVLVLFARASASDNSGVALPALILTWFLLIMFMATSGCFFTSVFWNTPVELRKWLTGEQPPVAAVDLPVIPDADSGWIGGGSSPNIFCDPQLAIVRSKYPNYNIEMTLHPEQHKSEYTPFKHDYYRYMCSFIAKMKAK